MMEIQDQEFDHDHVKINLLYILNNINYLFQVLDHVHQKIVIHVDIHHVMKLMVIIMEIHILDDLVIMKVNLKLFSFIHIHLSVDI